MDGVLGTVKFQMVKLVDGALGGTDKLTITTADGALVNLGANNDVTIASGTITTVSTVTTVSAVTAITNALPAGNNNIGDVDVLTCALPTGASTAAKQPALGTAGTASTDVITIQGIASGTVVPVTLTSTTITGTVAVTKSGTWDITNAGTFAVQENGAALTALQLIDNAISGAGFNITQFGGAAVPIGAGTEAAALRVTLPTDGTGVVRIGAGTALIGSVAAANATTTIYDGVTALTVKYAKIGTATSGENTLVALVASKKIRVLSLFLTSAASASAVNFYFKNGAAGSAIFGDATYAITLDRTGATGFTAFSLAYNPTGHFESASGAALILNLSAANGVAGSLSYVEV